jgi:hypothetical protein
MPGRTGANDLLVQRLQDDWVSLTPRMLVLVELTGLGHQDAQLRARLLDGHALLQPPDDREIVTSSIVGLRGIQRQRQPQLDAAVREVEALRHDTDDLGRHAVDLDLSSENLGVSAKSTLPEAVSEHCDRGCIRQRVRVRVGMPLSGTNADGFEELAGRVRRHDPNRLFVPDDRGIAVVPAGDRLVRAVPALQLEKLRRREPELVEVHARELREQLHQPLGIRIRQLPKHDGMHDAEDGGVGTNPESERQDCDSREARPFEQHSNRVAEVLK